MQSPTLQAQSDDVDGAVRAIWAEALERDHVEPHERFLELGGDSLTAMRIMWMVADRFQVNYPAMWFVDYPTSQDMASHIKAQQRPGAA
jgi:acyl carrier protein